MADEQLNFKTTFKKPEEDSFYVNIIGDLPEVINMMLEREESNLDYMEVWETLRPVQQNLDVDEFLIFWLD